jgi:obg-like ATPase 1
VINPLFLLTAKPVVYLVNLSEKDYIRQKNKYLPKVAEWIRDYSTGDPVIPISVSFEERLTRFPSNAEAGEECKRLGTKSALPKVIVTMRQALNLGSFFTTGSDEVRQWTIRKGTKAPQAAGVIHTGRCDKIQINRASANTWHKTLKRLSSRRSFSVLMRSRNMATRQPLRLRAKS